MKTKKSFLMIQSSIITECLLPKKERKDWARWQKKKKSECNFLIFCSKNKDGVGLLDGGEPVFSDDQMLDMEIETDLKNLSLGDDQ